MKKIQRDKTKPKGLWKAPLRSWEGRQKNQSETRPTRFLPKDWKSKHWRVCMGVNKLGGAALSSQSWEGGARATQSRGLGFPQNAQGKSNPHDQARSPLHSRLLRDPQADSLTSTSRQLPGTKWMESSFSRPTMPAVFAPPPQRPPLPPA